MATRLRKSTIWFFTILLIYFSVSKQIFDNVYSTSKMIIDEEFHLPLGLSYCKFEFLSWDPKVTTLPGLYLVSSVILGPFKLCTTYWLRFISLGASIVNILLFRIIYNKYQLKHEWRNILSSFTLSMLPPLYFFGNLYYTEMVSLSLILFMFIAYERELHFFASIFGTTHRKRSNGELDKNKGVGLDEILSLFVKKVSLQPDVSSDHVVLVSVLRNISKILEIRFGSIICRQTNVIWVGFLLGRYILIELYVTLMRRYIPANAVKGLPAQNLWRFGRQLSIHQSKLIHKTSLQFWLDVSAYSICLLSFGLFLKLNGSIVVGDKSAHQATLHFPQLFYYSLFCAFFAWPHFYDELKNFFNFVKSHKKMMMAIVAVMTIIVFKNTLVHPYMLADNRHYFFYIWNRFYGRLAFFRYIMIPVYIFAWYVIIKLAYDKNDISFISLYLPCVIAVLVTQKLIDVRYYLIPYIVFKLRLKNTKTTTSKLLYECLTYCIINTVVFITFFNKTITWPEYQEPQRLIW